MPTVTIYPVKFVDNAKDKQIEVTMSDESTYIINSMSGQFYTNTLDEIVDKNDTEEFKRVMRSRIQRYQLALNAQLSG
jgi:hypothetical protein